MARESRKDRKAAGDFFRLISPTTFAITAMSTPSITKYAKNSATEKPSSDVKPPSALLIWGYMPRLYSLSTVNGCVEASEGSHRPKGMSSRNGSLTNIDLLMPLGLFSLVFIQGL